MSQSVNVLGCLCSNCPDCSGVSQNYKEKKTSCAVCFMPACKVCNAERMGKKFRKRSVTVDKQEIMLKDDDVLSWNFDLLKRYSHFNDIFQACYQCLKCQETQGKDRGFDYYLGCKLMVQAKLIKITIGYEASLSDNGEGLHLTVKSCESSDLNRTFDFTFNEGQAAIDISVTSPEVTIIIFETYDNVNGAVLLNETGDQMGDQESYVNPSL